MRRALLAAVLLAGPAAAQVGPQAPLFDASLAVAIASPEGILAPLGPFASMQVTVTYRFMETRPETEAVPIALTAGAVPAWATATLSPATVYANVSTVPCGCEREVTQEAFLLVSFSQDAPAFRPLALQVDADAPAHGSTRAARANGSVEVTPGYRAAIDVTVPGNVERLDVGEQVEFPLTVANNANGASNVTFRLDPATPLPTGLAAEVPAPIRLGSRAQGERSTAETVFVVAATGRFNATRLTLLVNATSAERPGTEGAETLVSFVLGPVPAASAARPAPLAPALALVALALAARLRQR